MSEIKENQALKNIVALIREWTDGSSGKESEVNLNPKRRGLEIDLIYKTKDYIFLVECKGSGAVSSVNSAIETLTADLGKVTGKAVPVVAVPFMGESGRDLCKKREVSWLDLSGNAHIVAPGLRIHIEGKPNKFKVSGRPKDIFAPKSSRIARQLLIEPYRYITQRELAQETELDEGLVSRVVREMVKTNLLTRNALGAVKPKEPGILLDAWQERYAFSKHYIIKGFIAERSSSNVLHNLAESFEGNNLDYAVTGLSGAWLLTQFATYRISTMYLSEEPSDDLLKKLRFNREERGSNVWLVIPNDKGVFNGSSVKEGIRCVHPVQVYLDLKGHPERAKEAAKVLRERYLNWGNNDR